MTDHSRIETLRRRGQSGPASIGFAAPADEYPRTGPSEEAIVVCPGGVTARYRSSSRYSEVQALEPFLAAAGAGR